MKEEWRGGRSELCSDLDLDPDPDPWKILWIRIQQNEADPSDPDPQHYTICMQMLHMLFTCAEQNALIVGLKFERHNRALKLLIFQH